MTDPSVELAPCPFCGGEPAISDGGNGLHFRVICNNSNCRAAGPLERCAGDAVSAWRVRAVPPSTELGDEVERVAAKVRAAIYEAFHAGKLGEWTVVMGDAELNFVVQTVLAALRQSTRSIDDGWRDIATAPTRDVLLYFPALPPKRAGQVGHGMMLKVGRASEYPHRKPTHYHELPHPPSTEICDGE